MGGSGSIFDQASDDFKKKKDEAVKKEEAPPPKETISDEELRKMFENVYKLNDTVTKRLEDAYNAMGVSPKEIKDYLENPSNFPDNEQWLSAQKSRAFLLNKVEKAIIFEGKEPSANQKNELEKKKKKKDDSADKTRKGKTLGSRKGWMSM